jgi:hypothetical protein
VKGSDVRERVIVEGRKEKKEEDEEEIERERE